MNRKVIQQAKEFLAPFAVMVLIALTVTSVYGVHVTNNLAHLAASIEADIQSPSVAVRLAGRTIILEGVASDEGESHLAEAIALDYVASQSSKILFGARVVNLIAVKKPVKTAGL